MEKIESESEFCFVYFGPSMFPTFRSGNKIYVRPVKEDLRIGDVVVFTDHDRKKFVVHRVYAIQDSLLTTRGDNNTMVDREKIHLEEIIGRVEYTDKNGKKVPFKLVRSNLFMTRAKWLYFDVYHYSRNLLGQWYKIVRKQTEK